VAHDPLHVLYTNGILSHFLVHVCILYCIQAQANKQSQPQKDLQ
jgi:hypothetical protein